MYGVITHCNTALFSILTYLLKLLKKLKKAMKALIKLSTAFALRTAVCDSSVRPTAMEYVREHNSPKSRNALSCNGACART